MRTSPNEVSGFAARTIEFHEDSCKDLDELSKVEFQIFHKKRKKIKAEPERQNLPVAITANRNQSLVTPG